MFTNASPLTRHAFVATLVAVGVSVGAASASADEPPKPVTADPAPFKYASPADQARMARQAPLIAAADTIRAAVEQDLANPASGFTGITLADDSVVVNWKGNVPRGVKAAMDQARRTAPVAVAPAKFSKRELEATAQRIRDRLMRTAGTVSFATEIPADGSGVIVNTEGDVADAKREVVDAGVIGSGEPAITVRRKDVAETTASRVSDVPAWWGGGRINNQNRSTNCTAGFGVQNTYGSRFILTAGHCGAPSDKFYNGDWTKYVGMAYSKHTAYDLMLIPGDAGGRIWDGGVGVNEFSKDVVGSANVYNGEYLCTSGSVSGAMCGWKVNAAAYSYCGYAATGQYNCFSDLMTAPQVDGLIGIRHGDSGGPVFGLSGPNVIAKGIISGMAGGGTWVIFQDWATVVGVMPGLTPL